MGINLEALLCCFYNRKPLRLFIQQVRFARSSYFFTFEFV